jgi:pyruvate dehydrogenase (quinone)/pyruvate oxidase
VPTSLTSAEAAEVLNAGRKVAILADAGARGSGAAVEQLADTLAAPVVKTLSGKMVLSDDSPYTTGGIGLLGTGPSADLVDDIDTRW